MILRKLSPVARSDPRLTGVQEVPGKILRLAHSFVEIGHEIISMARDWS